MSKLIDLTGMIFERWTVIRYYGKDNARSELWLCRCSCEKTIERPVRGSALLDGSSKSCGCLRIEKLKENKKNKKYNSYDLESESYGIGISSNNGTEFYFDKEDYDLIKGYCWRLDLTNGNRISTDTNNKTMFLHRLIMGVEGDASVMIDHVNRKPQDNRKENLRLCNNAQNSKNGTIRKNNTSGVIGVYWSKKNSKYVAYINVDYKMKYLGSYINIEDAIRERLKAEKEMFGEFSPQTHLFIEYDID